MMKNSLIRFLLAGLVVLVAGCAPALRPLPTPSPRPTQAPQPTATAPKPTPTPGTGEENLAFLSALQTFAAQKYGARADEIKLIKVEPVDWPDACLGAAQPGEICLQVITPGYLLTVEIKGKTLELHTNRGDLIRPANTPSSGGETSPAAEIARLWMMDSLKVDASAIQITSVTAKDWPDGCLGVRKPGQACAAGIVPGYRVLLTANGVAYELRIGQDNKQVIVVDSLFQVASPRYTMLERPQLTWKSGGGNCMMVQAMEDQAAYGPCNSALKIVRMANIDRVKELSTLVAGFAPFGAQTPAGLVAFYGGGKGESTAPQQRALAEWASLLYQETSSNTPVPNLGLALSWQRMGGIAGFCDDLKIYRSGLAVISSCKPGAAQPAYQRWLDAKQLAQLFTWLDTLQSASGKQSDPATADAMTITWALTANGTHAVGDADRQALLDLALRILLSPR